MAPAPFDFRRLYDQCFDELYGLICRFGVKANDAEDLTQQAFLIAHRRMNEIGVVLNPEPWLRTIAVHVVQQHYRWRRVRAVRAWLVDHSWAARSVDDHTPERAAAADEELARVQWVLEHMSAKLRDTLVLLDLEQLDVPDVAEILCIPANTVRSRRLLARAEFRRLWRKATGTQRSTDDE